MCRAVVEGGRRCQEHESADRRAQRLQLAAYNRRESAATRRTVAKQVFEMTGDREAQKAVMAMRPSDMPLVATRFSAINPEVGERMMNADKRGRLPGRHNQVINEFRDAAHANVDSYVGTEDRKSLKDPAALDKADQNRMTKTNEELTTAELAYLNSNHMREYLESNMRQREVQPTLNRLVASAETRQKMGRVGLLQANAPIDVKSLTDEQRGALLTTPPSNLSFIDDPANDQRRKAARELLEQVPFNTVHRNRSLGEKNGKMTPAELAESRNLDKSREVEVRNGIVMRQNRRYNPEEAAEAAAAGDIYDEPQFIFDIDNGRATIPADPNVGVLEQTHGIVAFDESDPIARDEVNRGNVKDDTDQFDTIQRLANPEAEDMEGLREELKREAIFNSHTASMGESYSFGKDKKLSDEENSPQARHVPVPDTSVGGRLDNYSASVKHVTKAQDELLRERAKQVRKSRRAASPDRTPAGHLAGRVSTKKSVAKTSGNVTTSHNTKAMDQRVGAFGANQIAADYGERAPEVPTRVTDESRLQVDAETVRLLGTTRGGATLARNYVRLANSVDKDGNGVDSARAYAARNVVDEIVREHNNRIDVARRKGNEDEVAPRKNLVTNIVLPVGGDNPKIDNLLGEGRTFKFNGFESATSTDSNDPSTKPVVRRGEAPVKVVLTTNRGAAVSKTSAVLGPDSNFRIVSRVKDPDTPGGYVLHVVDEDMAVDRGQADRERLGVKL